MNTFWYLNNEIQYRLFPYNGVLSIGPLSVEVTELEEIEKVEFYADRWLIETDTTSPYGFYWTWSLIQLFRLRHTLRIVAYDVDGNYYSEDEIFPVWKFL